MTENLETLPNAERYLHLPRYVFENTLSEGDTRNITESYFLSVAKSNGMINAGIHDGDMLVFYQTENIPSGAVVAVSVSGGEIMCRRYIKENRKIRLRRENGRTPDIVADKSEVKIFGVLVSLIRRYWTIQETNQTGED